jgi:hypothetical protein
MILRLFLKQQVYNSLLEDKIPQIHYQILANLGLETSKLPLSYLNVFHGFLS